MNSGSDPPPTTGRGSSDAARDELLVADRPVRAAVVADAHPVANGGRFAGRVVVELVGEGVEVLAEAQVRWHRSRAG